MTINTLSLPIDIPWKRLCVSDDMIDEKVCDREFPYRWRSSVVVFSYEPPEEHQTYDDASVSYLKVVSTITGLQAGEEVTRELGLPPDLKNYPFNDKDVTQLGIDSINKYYGCYGAILEVSIKPKGDQPKSKYPYFIDFEPKKREIYELVSETGEMMSRSLSNVNVQKGTTTTQTHEVLDIFKGASAEAKVGSAGVGGSFQGEWGTKDITQHEYANSRATDQSREMRELFSHTTQLSQMYHQFTSYHLGTNRAVFVMLPRPHIVQSEHTFVNGPRELEGIQDVFLVVMRPKDVKEFCVEAYLETAHLSFLEEQYTTDTKADTIKVGNAKLYKRPSLGPFSEWVYRVWDEPASGIPKEDKSVVSPDPEIAKESSGKHVILEQTKDFAIPKGWELDLDKVQNGYTLEEIHDGLNHISEAQVTEVTEEKISVRAIVGLAFVKGKEYVSGGKFLDKYLTFGELTVNFTMYLRKTGEKPEDVPTTLFITGRGVCCCPPDRISEDHPTAVAVLVEKPKPEWTRFSRTSGSIPIQHANLWRTEIGRSMLHSVNDPHRYARGTVSLIDTQFLAHRIAQKLSRLDHPDNDFVKDIAGLNREVLDKVIAQRPQLRRADVLRMQLQETKDRFDLNHEEAIHLRRAALGVTAPVPEPKYRWDPPNHRVEHSIPNVTGLSLSEAETLLHRESLLIGEVANQDSEQPTGIILSQQPIAGEAARAGSEINVVVSTGLTVRIPEIAGKLLSEALCMLREAGLRSEPELNFVSDRQKPNHTVLEIAPAIRTYVPPNSRVVLNVSRK